MDIKYEGRDYIPLAQDWAQWKVGASVVAVVHLAFHIKQEIS
jgi:hypothetical protein